MSGPADPRDVRIAELEAELAAARQRISALEGPPDFPLHWDLTTDQRKILGLLVDREFASHDAIQDRLWGDRVGGAPDGGVKVVQVQVSHIRRHLRPLGVTVRNVWGRGYTMDVGHKALLKAAIARAGAELLEARG